MFGEAPLYRKERIEHRLQKVKLKIDAA